MDQRRFDDLTRLLGASGTRRGGLRAALGGLLGVGAGAGAAEIDAEAKRRERHPDADAGKKHRKKSCKPACTDGHECVKVGRKRECQCRSGVTCGTACCAAGETCVDGACSTSPEPTCIPAGQPCKNVGRRCCDGRACASGQGGETDVACYAPKTGACGSTADCVYGTVCIDGRCDLDVPGAAALGAPCDAVIGQRCATPGAVCTVYEGADAPAGTYCTLPRRAACAVNPDCTSHECWYEDPAAGASARDRRLRSDAFGVVCCGSGGLPCAADGDCCLGSVCVAGGCQPETCDVCAGGRCPYATIAAAYADVANKPAGSTITIAPGDYAEAPIELDRDVTFRRCGSVGTVVWRNSGSAGPLLAMKNGHAASSVTLMFIEFTMTPNVGVLHLTTFGGRSAGQRLRVSALGCAWRDFVSNGGSSAVELGPWTDAAFTECAFRGNLLGAGRGPAIYTLGDTGARTTLSLTRCAFSGNRGPEGGALTVTNTDLTATGSTFTGNTALGPGGAIYMALHEYPTTFGSSASLHDCTISGNTALADGYEGGAGIWVCPFCTLAVSGTTTVNGNTAGTYGSGIRVAVDDGYPNPSSFAPGRITGTTPANVSGNDSAPDCQIFGYFYGGYYDERYAVSCDTWCVASGGACGVDVTTCCDGQPCSNVVFSVGTCP